VNIKNDDKKNSNKDDKQEIDNKNNDKNDKKELDKKSNDKNDKQELDKKSSDKNDKQELDKKNNNKNDKQKLDKKKETSNSLLEKILDKRPPLIPINNDGKESNLKLKNQRNRDRHRNSSISEKRYGNKKKFRGHSSLETIKEDEELSNNKLPIRRVAKYSVDFKKDKPGQIIPHSMPRTRMPPSNKKQKIQNEIQSTLLNHTRQLQQRVFYLESKRLELQDLISEYELEKETLTKQLDKQTNVKGK